MSTRTYPESSPRFGAVRAALDSAFSSGLFVCSVLQEFSLAPLFHAPHDGGTVRIIALSWVVLLSVTPGVAATQHNGGERFESLGIPVRKGGLMGCIVGPDGRGGQAPDHHCNQL